MPTSWIFSPSATKLQTADKRVWHMSVTTHPSASLPPPTPRVTSLLSDFTLDLYIKSLEESLAAARDCCASDATTRTPVPPAFNPFMFLQTKLAEQCKQLSEVMAQNATLMVALSKGGGCGNREGGGGGRGNGGSGNNNSRHKTPWKEKNSPLCPNCSKVVLHNPATCFFPL